MRYIAFLRAINVGGHIVKMERLRKIFEELGFSKVESFINSGNVIFDSSSQNEEVLRKKIEKGLQSALGYEVATFLRTDEELAEIARRAEGDGLFIVFLSDKPTEAARVKVTGIKSEVDDLKFHGREIYWRCLVSFSDSKFSGARLEKALSLRATVRNANTVRKLAAKYAPAER